LERVDNQIELISDVNFLADGRLLHLELELVHVKLLTEPVSQGYLVSNVVLDANQESILLSRLVSEDLDFILQILIRSFISARSWEQF